MFNPEGMRDPFKPLVAPEQQNEVTAEQSTGGGIKPDTARRKEDLEAFPLEVLKMVGTVVMKSNLWGLVKADDGTIHRVQAGNYMGKNYGKIIRISTDKIELMEIVPDKPGLMARATNVISVNRVILGIKMNTKQGGIMLNKMGRSLLYIHDLWLVFVYIPNRFR